MKTITLIPLLALALASGCASPRFVVPALPPKYLPAGFSVTVAPVEDTRQNRALNRVFAKTFSADVQAALAAQLASTGRYMSVHTAATDAPPDTDLVMHATLRRLEWEVPSYGEALVGAAVVPVAFGAIGAAFYGSSDISVNGHAEVAVRILKLKDERVLLDRVYVGRHSETTAKFSCDTPSTKARMAAKAFDDAMRQLRRDLGGP